MTATQLKIWDWFVCEKLTAYLNSNADTLEGCSLLYVTFVCSAEQHHHLHYQTFWYDNHLTSKINLPPFWYKHAITKRTTKFLESLMTLKPQLNEVGHHHLVNPHCNYMK